LLNYLAEEEDPEVLLAVKPELGSLQTYLSESDESDEQAQLLKARSQLSPRRRRFDSSEPKAQSYLQALGRLARTVSFPENINLLEEEAKAGQWIVELGFYLMVYDARESLETARQWSNLGKGAVALSLGAVVDGLFEAT